VSARCGCLHTPCGRDAYPSCLKIIAGICAERCFLDFDEKINDFSQKALDKFENVSYIIDRSVKGVIPVGNGRAAAR